MIAQRLGISRTAVAAGLGLYRGKTVALTKEIKERIVETAKEMGYRPNRFAQNVAGRNSGVLGVMSFGGIGQATTQRTKEVSRAIQNAGYEMILHEVGWDSPENASLVLHLLMDYHVEGVILIEPTDWFDFSLISKCQENGTPVVLMGGRKPRDIPHVIADEYLGMRELVGGLIERGARHLTLLSPLYTRPDMAESTAHTERGSGFVETIRENGGTIVEGLSSKIPKRKIVGTLMDIEPILDWGDPYRSGYVGMEKVLNHAPLPDVVCCMNDDWAFGALRRCRELGVNVPEDLWLAGNDGLIMSAYGETPLTTIEQPWAKMATEAVGMVVQMLGGEKISRKNTIRRIPPTLVWRRSTEKLPGRREGRGGC